MCPYRLESPNLPLTPEGEGDVTISTHRWFVNPQQRVGPSFLSTSSLLQRGVGRPLDPKVAGEIRRYTEMGGGERGSPLAVWGPTLTLQGGGGTRKPGPTRQVYFFLKKFPFACFFFNNLVNAAGL